MTGKLSTLNVGEGDIQIAFNGDDDAEVEKALAMLEDMQQRGYAILVRQPDGKYARAIGIDREAKSYIVAQSIPASESPSVRVQAPEAAGREEEAGAEQPATPAPSPAPAKRRGRPARQPIASSDAIAVGRSAGG